MNVIERKKERKKEKALFYLFPSRELTFSWDAIFDFVP